MKINLEYVHEASRVLANSTEKDRNAFLENLVRVLGKRKQEITHANQKDVELAKGGYENAFLQRLILDEDAIDTLCQRLRSVSRLKSGLGEVMEQQNRKDGIIIKKRRVPLGTLLVIYESRPEVTIDVAALCIKSGNCAILKGGSEALYTNAVLHDCICDALRKSNFPEHVVSLISDRKTVKQLLRRSDDIDLVIARGGYEMVKAIMEESTIPVLAHAAGGARIFLDKSADQSVVEKVVVNAKIDKPAACNSLDTILVHHDVARKLLPPVVSLFREHGVSVKGDAEANRIVKMPRASVKDWGTESLGLSVTIKIVSNVDEAIAFISKHGKRHSEGIVANDKIVIDRFTRSVDAAALFINCSTRLHDGYVFGLGTEMGISTGKLHARGPVGLRELTTYRWETYGKGHIRE